MDTLFSPLSVLCSTLSPPSISYNSPYLLSAPPSSARPNSRNSQETNTISLLTLQQTGSFLYRISFAKGTGKGRYPMTEIGGERNGRGQNNIVGCFFSSTCWVLCEAVGDTGAVRNLWVRFLWSSWRLQTLLMRFQMRRRGREIMTWFWVL